MTDQEGRFDEVSSWIENEHRCVSVAEICHHYGISRTAAAELLSAVRDKGEEFESTSLVSTEACMDFGDEKGVTTTTFRLCKGANDGPLYALRQHNSAQESLRDSHERLLSMFRDLLASRKFEAKAPSDMLILPSQQVGVDMNNVQLSDSRVTVPTTEVGSKKQNHPKVSASSFFQTSSTKTEKKKPGRTEKAASGKENSKSSTATTKKASLSKSRAERLTKETSVGRVDDIVGDEESDEEDFDVTNANQRSGSRKAASIRIVDDDDEEEELEEKKEKTKKKKAKKEASSGAMDAFTVQNVASKEPPPVSTGATKRRRKLVEKTTTDENGYFHTEMVEEWEDVPASEVAETQPTSSNNGPARKKSNSIKKKQGSLMGFFSAK